MKKIIKLISLLILVNFSFFYTDKVMNLISYKDPLMDKINNVKDNYDVMPVNAVIEDDTIIPGIKGREVEVNKSYEQMKVGGIFRQEALVYKDLYPSRRLSNNIDKYIIKGNNSNKKVSLIYIVNNGNIDKIINKNNITLFINHKYLTIGNISKLKNFEIYSYGDNGIYSDEVLTNDNTLISRLSNNKGIYCLSKEKNSSVLDICNKNNMYVVIPSIIGDYIDIKNNLTNGSIILLNNLTNIDIIIKYISGKGYEIVPLNDLLTE